MDTHKITDQELHYRIIPKLKRIYGCTITLSQGDHNSEIITFEIPRYVEGHDMFLCDRIVVNYNNISNDGKQNNVGSYDCKILNSSEDENNSCLYFDWTVSGNATMYAGYVEFNISFYCHDEDGNITYTWGTDDCNLITIKKKNRYSPEIVKNNPDLIQQINNRIKDVENEFQNKLDKDQGVDNAGKIMSVDESGYIIPADKITKEQLPIFDKPDYGKFLKLDENGNIVTTNYFSSSVFEIKEDVIENPEIGKVQLAMDFEKYNFSVIKNLHTYEKEILSQSEKGYNDSAIAIIIRYENVVTHAIMKITLTCNKNNSEKIDVINYKIINTFLDCYVVLDKSLITDFTCEKNGIYIVVKKDLMSVNANIINYMHTTNLNTVLHGNVSTLNTENKTIAGSINELNSNKLNENQGLENAGKILAINEEGSVEPQEFINPDFNERDSSSKGYIKNKPFGYFKSAIHNGTINNPVIDTQYLVLNFDEPDFNIQNLRTYLAYGSMCKYHGETNYKPSQHTILVTAEMNIVGKIMKQEYSLKSNMLSMIDTVNYKIAINPNIELYVILDTSTLTDMRFENHGIYLYTHKSGYVSICVDLATTGILDSRFMSSDIFTDRQLEVLNTTDKSIAGAINELKDNEFSGDYNDLENVPCGMIDKNILSFSFLGEDILFEIDDTDYYFYDCIENNTDLSRTFYDNIDNYYTKNNMAEDYNERYDTDLFDKLILSIDDFNIKLDIGIRKSNRGNIVVYNVIYKTNGGMPLFSVCKNNETNECFIRIYNPFGCNTIPGIVIGENGCNENRTGLVGGNYCFNVIKKIPKTLEEKYLPISISLGENNGLSDNYIEYGHPEENRYVAIGSNFQIYNGNCLYLGRYNELPKNLYENPVIVVGDGNQFERKTTFTLDNYGNIHTTGDFYFKTNEFNNSYESLSVFYQAYNSNRIEENRTSGTFYFKANDLYVLPELETLSYSLIAPPRNGKVYEYHFFFTSGATATVITHPEGVLHNLTVEPNKKYEISILENCLSYQCWDLSATTSVSEEEIVDESEVV